MATVLITKENVNNFRNLPLNKRQYELILQVAIRTNNMEDSDDVIFTRMFVTAVKLELQAPAFLRSENLNEAIELTLWSFDTAKKDNDLKGWRKNKSDK